MRKTTPRKPSSNQKNAKWDWDVIRVLYFSGMELSQIVQLPRFEGLSLMYAKTKAYDEGWATTRREIRSGVVNEAAHGLAEQMMIAIQDHQKWLMERMKKERKIVDQELLSGGKTMITRLEATKMIDDMTRKSLGMDDHPTLSPKEKEMGLIILMQGKLPPTKKLDSSGILSSAQGIIEMDQEDKNGRKMGDVVAEAELVKLEGKTDRKPLSPLKACNGLVNEPASDIEPKEKNENAQSNGTAPIPTGHRQESKDSEGDGNCESCSIPDF
jgi:hypothetical protein